MTTVLLALGKLIGLYAALSLSLECARFSPVALLFGAGLTTTVVSIRAVWGQGPAGTVDWRGTARGVL
ncbi:MAG: hypothetical protein HY815_16960 [Candidatus Riflebacteria bacterium]|nr:hypothetical protein [Candidatus Riflebacteria bacterium]